MYYPKDKIDTNQELQAIIEYVALKWEGFQEGELEFIVTTAFNQGLERGKFWIKNGINTEQAKEIPNIRSDIRNWSSVENYTKYKALEYYDSIHNLFTGILLNSLDMGRTILKDWDYSNETKKLAKLALKNGDESKRIKPIGWKELYKNYHKNDGMEDYYEQSELDKDLFKGCKFNSAGDSGLLMRISLPDAMYSEVEQGYKAVITLISSIFSHALSVSSHNNDIAIKEDIENIIKEIKDEKYYTKIQKEINLEPYVKTPHIKAMLRIISNENKNIHFSDEEFDMKLEAQFQKNNEYLSEEDKAIRKQQSSEVFKQIADMLSQPLSASRIEKLEEEKKPKEEIYKEVFAEFEGVRKKIKP